MQVRIDRRRELRFDDGEPVTAASALAPLGDGWLVAQDDSTHGALVTPSSVTRLRLLPPVEGLDRFSEAAGSKHLKPDLEAACRLDPGVLLLGSGSTAARRRAVLVTGEGDPQVRSGDLTGLYDRVSDALDVPEGQLNLEGVARNGAVLRWFARGNAAAGVLNGSVDVDLRALVDAVVGRRDPAGVPLRAARHYDLGELTATDAVALPGGRVLLAVAAEDTPNAYDDGQVLASGLVLLDGDDVLDRVALPEVDAVVQKVEGLGILALREGGVRLLAVVDADDPEAPSAELVLELDW